MGGLFRSGLLERAGRMTLFFPREEKNKNEEHAPAHCRLDLNNPTTTVGGIFNFLRLVNAGWAHKALQPHYNGLEFPLPLKRCIIRSH